MPRLKMAHSRESLNVLVNFVDRIANHEILVCYEYFRTLQELVNCEQYQRGKQLKLDSFFKQRSIQPRTSTKPQPHTSTKPQLSTSTASASLLD